jgi:hypothetical protein
MKRRVDEKAVSCGRRGDVSVVAVSKNNPPEALQDAYEAGCRDFGENRVQELLPKMEALPSDCRWHFIGSLQKNKAAKVLQKEIHLIHSVHDAALAEKLADISEARGKTTSILLQVNVSQEATKQGLSPLEWERHLTRLAELPAICIKGLMTMAPMSDDSGLIRKCFRSLYELKEKWKNEMKDPAGFCHLSMGMTQDYEIAIEEGATLIRIGTAIFGNN